MRNLDFSSWQAVLSTLVGLAVITLIGVGIRLIVMQIVQARRERENRQINERLRTLIAAYKTLGGSFTGDLSVDPTHLRDLQRRGMTGDDAAASGIEPGNAELAWPSTERSRRIRDAVEGALSDILLLGTDEQVPPRRTRGGGTGRGPAGAYGGAGGVAAGFHPRRAGPGTGAGGAGDSATGAEPAVVGFERQGRRSARGRKAGRPRRWRRDGRWRNGRRARGGRARDGARCRVGG